MKKLYSILLALLLFLTAFCFPVSAGENLNDSFRQALNRLDMYYEFNAEYVVSTLSRHFYSWEEAEKNDFEPIIVDGAAYEAEMNKRFLIDDELLSAIRLVTQYDAAKHTYWVEFSGAFGGAMEERIYRGFVQNADGSYTVYYETINYIFLYDIVGDDDPIWEQIEAQGWPYEVEYGGRTYENGPEGYFCFDSYEGTGRCYTVEYQDGNVRLLAADLFGKGEMPETFASGIIGIVVDDLGTGVVIEGEDAFEDGTLVKVRTATNQPTVTAVMNGREPYAAFEITADRNGTAVQPNAPTAVTFPIPSAWESTNVSVYYLNEDDGSLVALVTVVDAEARTATAELSHFSLYVLAEAPAVSEETEEESTEDNHPTATDTATESVPPMATTEAASDSLADDGDGSFSSMFLLPMVAAVVIAGMAVAIALAKKKK